MSDSTIGPRIDRDRALGYQDTDHLDEARRTQETNASWVRSSMAKRDLDTAAHMVGEGAAISLSPGAFQNPALLRSTASATPPTPTDACANAAPTRVVVGPMPRGQELQKAVDFSCVDKNGVCVSKEDLARLQDLRQAACLRTGLDPFRFQVVAPRGPEVHEDRARLAADRDAAALQNLGRMAQNPFAAAGYSGARLGGASEQTSQSVGQLAGVAGDVLMAAAVVGAGARAANAPAPAKADLRPLTSTEVNVGRQFLAANGTPPGLIDKTLSGFATGMRVETLAEDLHVFRYYGGDAVPRGRWLTEQPATRPVAELALAGQNPATKMAEWVIPKGSVVLRGPAAPLNEQPGGASQIFVPNPAILREP